MKNLNYFTLLGLSFEPVEEDEEKIKKAIEVKRAYWSSMINHPSKSFEAKLFLEKLPEIQKIMLGNKEERLKYVKEAKIQRDKILRDAKIRLSRTISVLSAKGYITYEEFESIVSRYPELGRSFVLAKTKIHLKEAPRKHSFVEPLLYKKIRVNLDILNITSLYNFLNMKNTATIVELQEANARIYEEIRRIGKKDMKATAKGELHGLCKIVFKTRSTKEEYDQILRKEKLNYIDEILDICAVKRVIYENEYSIIKEIIIEDGFLKEEAKDYILGYCIRNKVCLLVGEEINSKGYMEKNAEKNQVEATKNKADGYKYNEDFIEVTKDPLIYKQNKSNYTKAENRGKENTETQSYKHEVYDVLTKVGDRYIKVYWKNPTIPHYIEVWKKEGDIPMFRGDGQLIAKTKAMEVIDYQVENGKTYGYLIKVIYTKDNKEYETEGRTCFDTPKAPKNIDETNDYKEYTYNKNVSSSQSRNKGKNTFFERAKSFFQGWV
ncbi:hypothetical protein [Clostridium cellulovorans]|uniref:Uncharacterized protein n=1 Tax=Clostridium cellulovorans (strain ATCC 35296 / DSM 3052 / OCM 3 / 743B) TaxID=573061 RepID=D9SVB1_CLOC7|nr:hypothetical protein [Clostridium cellulovorans]ADL51035.1 hypothetical protein Clocel_1280 [Clostridium cellulovorans 743B]